MALDPSLCWTKHAVCVFDVETTGVDPLTCGVVSVAAVRFEHGREVDRFYSLINPRMPIPEASSEVHGIRDDDVADAPCISHVAMNLFAIARDAVPCGYNAIGYDRIVLHRHIKGTDCALFDPDHAWIDPLVIVRECDRWERGKGRHKLENVCRRHGVELDAAHNAASDASATGRLLYRLLEKGLVKPCALDRLLEHQEKTRARQETEFREWLARQPKPEAPA